MLTDAEESQLRDLLTRVKTNTFVGTPLRGGLPLIPQRTALPTASADFQGLIIYIPGASGTADGAYICEKSAADTYSWVRCDTAANATILRYSNTSEVTTVSTSAVDLLTSSALSIPVTSGIIIEGVARKTSGAAAAATLGLKLNSTVVVEAVISTYQIWVSSATDRAESGAFRVEIMPRSANYLSAGVGTYSVTGTGTVGTGPIIAGTANFPNATITSIAIRGISGSGSVTLAVKEVAVFEVLYS